MRQTVRLFGLLLAVVMLALTGCSDDKKDEPDNGGDRESSLVGRWVEEDGMEYACWNFTQNGVLEIVSYTIDNPSNIYRETAKWSTKGNVLRLRWDDDEDDRFEYEIRGNTLILIYDEEDDFFTLRLTRL